MMFGLIKEEKFQKVITISRFGYYDKPVMATGKVHFFKVFQVVGSTVCGEVISIYCNSRLNDKLKVGDKIVVFGKKKNNQIVYSFESFEE